MRDAMIAIVLISAVALLSYRVGYSNAETRYKHQATLAAEVIEDAVSRASDALSGLVQTIATDDGHDTNKLKEIEDAARNDGAVCYVPADKLRALDAITN